MPKAPLGVAYDNVSVRVTEMNPSSVILGDNMNCEDLLQRNITDLGTDPNRLDADHDGIGCEE